VPGSIAGSAIACPAIFRIGAAAYGDRADERRGMDIYGPVYGYICLYGYLWI
jgi:hypothetical protein